MDHLHLYRLHCDYSLCTGYLKFKCILKSWNSESDKCRKGFQGKREAVVTWRIKVHPREIGQRQV